MNKQFKPGDIVRRSNKNNGSNGAKIGQIASVVSQDDFHVYVRFDGAQENYAGQGEGWYPENVERVRDLQVATVPADPFNWVPISGELSRTYIFPDNQKVVIRDVVRLCVRPTNHRLETASGRRYIVPGKFLAIEINAPEGWAA